MSKALLEVTGLKKYFPLRVGFSGMFRAMLERLTEWIWS